MTKDEKLKLLEIWIKRFHAIQKAYDDAKALLGASPESPMVTAMYDAFQGYTDALGAQIGDQSNWLDWYLWDNDAGKRGFQAGEKGKERPIRNLKHLVNLLQP